MKRVAIQSSNLKSAGYDNGTRVLEVEFHSGTIYHYLDVPVRAVRDLFEAESAGRFFNANIRNAFRCHQQKDEAAESALEEQLKASLKRERQIKKGRVIRTTGVAQSKK